MYFDIFLSISFPSASSQKFAKSPLAVGMGESQQSVQMINDKIKPFLLLKSLVSGPSLVSSWSWSADPMVRVGFTHHWTPLFWDLNYHRVMTLTDFVVQVKMRQTWENLHNSAKKV